MALSWHNIAATAAIAMNDRTAMRIQRSTDSACAERRERLALMRMIGRHGAICSISNCRRSSKFVFANPRRSSEIPLESAPLASARMFLKI